MTPLATPIAFVQGMKMPQKYGMYMAHSKIMEVDSMRRMVVPGMLLNTMAKPRTSRPAVADTSL